MDFLTPKSPLTQFRADEECRDRLRQACESNDDIASVHVLGESEEGRPIDGYVIGHGPLTVSLIAGNHADEPVGPETLRMFILESLSRRVTNKHLFDSYRFVVIRHTNPDGASRNWRWMQAWPSLEKYLSHVDRERPGRDMEFGFPSLRVENQHISRFLGQHAPFALHMSFHGMGYSEGAMLLIERHWISRTGELRSRFVQAVTGAGLDLHDHDRKGEKGFVYIAPGFTTTPDGEAMRNHFRSLGDEEMASCFESSSMEYVRSLGGDPLCLVTELPLFVIHRDTHSNPGEPRAYLAFKEDLPRIIKLIQDDIDIQDVIEKYGIRSLNLQTAIYLQLTTLMLALQTIEEAGT